MDSVSLDATSSDKILLLVKSNKTQFQASISKEVLARSPVLRNLRVPLRSSTSLNVPSGYAQIWHKHVQAASKQICSSTDTTDSLSLLLKAAAFLEDEDSVSAVCGELGKRLFSALSGTQQHTKKRKREDEGEREGTVSSSRISCSVADQILSDLPNSVATKLIKETGATLDTCFEMLSVRFHPLVLEAICPSVSSDTTLSIDGSPQQWSQRGTGARLPLPGVHKQHHPKVSSRSLLCLFDATATLTTLSALNISLAVGRESNPVTDEVSNAFSNALSQLSALTSLEVRASLAEVSVPAVSNALPRLEKLQRLIIEDGQLSSDHICKLTKHLKRLPQLTSLSLSDSHLVMRTPKAASSLAARFSSLKNLQDLNIAEFRSFGKSKKTLSALSALTSLTRLDVESIGMVPETLPVFTEAIRSMPHLQHVSMRYNQVGKIHLNSIPRASEVAESIKPLCKALLSLKELRTVDLSCTHLGYGGAKHVVKELSQFKKKTVRGHSLELLNLDGNMQRIELYSEYYRACSGGHPEPDETNKVFRNESSWLQISASN